MLVKCKVPHCRCLESYWWVLLSNRTREANNGAAVSLILKMLPLIIKLFTYPGNTKILKISWLEQQQKPSPYSSWQNCSVKKLQFLQTKYILLSLSLFPHTRAYTHSYRGLPRLITVRDSTICRTIRSLQWGQQCPWREPAKWVESAIPRRATNPWGGWNQSKHIIFWDQQ